MGLHPCLCPFWYLWLLVRSLGLLLLRAVLGAVKGAIVFLPVFLLIVPTWTLAALLNWPRQIGMTYYTIGTTAVSAAAAAACVLSAHPNTG